MFYISSTVSDASNAAFDASNSLFNASNATFHASNDLLHASNIMFEASNASLDASNATLEASNEAFEACSVALPRRSKDHHCMVRTIPRLFVLATGVTVTPLYGSAKYKPLSVPITAPARTSST